MNQGDLTRAIAKRFFLTQTESQEIIELILEEITQSLRVGERAYLRGFGSFTKKTRSAKRVRHPKTGQIITIPKRVTVDFAPSNHLLKELWIHQNHRVSESIQRGIQDAKEGRVTKVKNLDKFFKEL